MLKKLSIKIESLFDHDNHNSLAQEHLITEARHKFEITDNLAHLENLSYVFNFEVKDEDIENLFSQISCYFEINFLLYKQSNKKYKPRASVLYGKKINTIESWPIVSLPQVPIFKVYKTNAHQLLKKFFLQELDPQNKMFCYLLKLSEECVLVLATQTAEPWAKLRIETLQNTLMKINFDL